MSAEKLCRVTNRVQLDLFSPESESWTQAVPLSDAIEARNSSFLVVEALGVACIGGYDAKYSAFLRDAFLISATDGSVQMLPSLSIARCGLGLIFAAGCIYAFGGRDVKLIATCEKLQAGEQEWTVISPMASPRAYFNPVRVSDNIYLCGGLTASCEVFSLSTGVFAPLVVELPESSESVAVESSGALLILTSRFLTRWTENAGAVSDEFRTNCCKASCGPVAVGEVIYVVSEGEAWKVDLQHKTTHVLGRE